MRSSVTLAALLLALLAREADANACACCSEPGQRTELTSKLQTYEKDELEKLRFAKKARLFMTAAGTEGVQGITDPTDTYELTQSRAGQVWTFSLKDEKGKTGTLAFTLPADIESFFVDLRDGKPGTDPVLYKEWRLSAPLTATGVFAPSAKGSPTVRLVLQGRGNACTSADQFSHYMLIVSGPNARFELYGALTTAQP